MTRTCPSVVVALMCVSGEGGLGPMAGAWAGAGVFDDALSPGAGHPAAGLASPLSIRQVTWHWGISSTLGFEEGEEVPHPVFRKARVSVKCRQFCQRPHSCGPPQHHRRASLGCQ